MDTGRGEFARVSQDVFEEAKQKGMCFFFKEREIVELKGSKFIIWKIEKNTLTLKLLPHKNDE